MPIIPRTEPRVEAQPAPQRAVDLQGGAIGAGMVKLGAGITSAAHKAMEDREDLDMFNTKMAVAKHYEDQEIRQREFDAGITGDGSDHTAKRLAELDQGNAAVFGSLPNNQKARQWAALQLQGMRQRYGESSYVAQQNHIGYYKATELENFGVTKIASGVTGDEADFEGRLNQLDAMVQSTKGINRPMRDKILQNVTNLMVERFVEAGVERGDVDLRAKADAIIKRYRDRQPEPTPGRTGQKFSADVEDAITSAAGAAGVDAGMLGTFARIESSGKPGARTGSYKGLFQLSDEEFRKYGGGDIYNAKDNAAAAARKLKAEMDEFAGKYGREPTATEIYMIHQQGVGGSDAHMRNPDRPAWQNMASTGEGRQKGERWAKQAIWGNIPDDIKKQFPGGVESVTSGDFLKLWENKVAKLSGSPVGSDLQGAHMETLEFADASGGSNLAHIDKSRAEGFAIRSLIHNLSNIDQKTAKLRAELEQKRQVAGFLDQSRPYNPADTEHNKAVDAVFEKARLGERMTAGDPQAIADGTQAAITLGRPPKDVAQGIYGLILNDKDPNKQRAGYEAAASIMQSRPHAFATAANGETIAKDARHYTELVTTGALTPQEAMDRIKETRSPEWAAKSKAREEEGKRLSKKLKAESLIDAFDPGAFSWGPDMSTAGSEDVVGFSTFREKFEHHYINTGNEDVAKRLAAKEMRRTYGVSKLPSQTGTLGSEIVKYPVTMFNDPAPDRGGGFSYQWIDRDLEQTVKAASGKAIPAKDIRAVADTKSQEEIRRLGQPRYQVFYKDPDRPGEWVPLQVRNERGELRRWAPDRAAYMTEFAQQYEKDRGEALVKTEKKVQAEKDKVPMQFPTSGYKPPGDDAELTKIIPEFMAESGKREQAYRESRKLPAQKLFRMPDTGKREKP
jgi:hypothetical protein